MLAALYNTLIRLIGRLSFRAVPFSFGRINDID